MVDLGLELCSDYKKLIDHVLTTEDPVGFRWDYLLLFMQHFGKTFEGDEEIAFKKRFNPEGKDSILLERAIVALLEFVRKEEVMLMLETESHILDPKTHTAFHHAEDFRWMLKAMGEVIPDNYIQHFIKEALGRSDDLFELNVDIENICRTEIPEDPNKKKKQRGLGVK
jgi:hypothetical protein